VDPVFVESVDEVPSVLADLLADGDVLVTQGAGDVGALVRMLVAESEVAS
jgi:UDP-N-acetylmuramate--alanine ligase